MQGMQNSRMARVWTWVALRALAIGPIAAVLIVSPASPAVGTANAAATKGFVYGGQTSQGKPVVVEMARSGRMVKRALVALELTCESGGSFTWTDYYTQLRLRGGRFASVYEDDFLDGNMAVELSGTISGRVRRSAVRGTWRFSVRSRDIVTGETDSCQSGSVRFTARP